MKSDLFPSPLTSIALSVAGMLTFMAGSTMALVTLPRDQGEITFKSQLRATYDTNITGSGSEGGTIGDGVGEASDVELSFTPMVNFTRRSGLIALETSLGGSFGRYLDNSQFDYDHFRSSFDLSFPNDESYRYQFSLSGGFNQRLQKDRFLGTLTDSDTFNLGARMSYRVNERWGVGVSSAWSNITYPGGGGRLTDQTRWSSGVHLDYIYSEKLSLRLNYDYSDTQSAFDSKDHSWSVSAVGQLTPAIEGTLGIGYRLRNSDVGNSSDPLLIAGLNWNPPFERVTVNLDITSGFDTTSTGSSSTNYGAIVGVGYAVSGKVAAAFQLGYSYASYDDVRVDRTDKDFHVSAGLSWAISESMTVELTTRWNDNRSDVEGFSYDSWSTGLALTSSF